MRSLRAAALASACSASSATRARPSCRCSSTSRPTSATCSACRNRSWSAWPTATRRRPQNAAFVNLHSAVGVGHAMGAIFTACKNRTPLVITAGQQARSLFPFDPFLFAAQATELPKPYVKWSGEPARAEDVPRRSPRAYYIAMQPPRGPVLVSIPSDDWARPASPSSRAASAARRAATPPSLAAIGAALDALRAPAFVDRRRRRPRRRLGRGARARRAPSRARLHRADVGRSGFPEDHPLFAGFLPAMREPIVDALPATTWCSCSARPRSRTTSKATARTCRPAPALCQIIDDAESPRWAPVGTAVVATCGRGARPCWQRPAPPTALAPPAARAARRAPSRRRRCRSRIALQTLPGFATPSTSSSKSAEPRPVMHGHLPTLQARPSTRWPAAASASPAGRRRRGAGAARDARDRAGRRRLGDVLDPGPLERGAAEAADHVRHPQQPALRGAAASSRRPSASQPAPSSPAPSCAGLDFVALARGHGRRRAFASSRPEALRDVAHAALRSVRRRWSRSTSPEQPPGETMKTARRASPLAVSIARLARRLAPRPRSRRPGPTSRSTSSSTSRPAAPPTRSRALAAAAAGRAGTAGRGREPRRRRRQRRRRRGREVGARRLHAADELGRHGLGQSAHLRRR